MLYMYSREGVQGGGGQRKKGRAVEWQEKAKAMHWCLFHPGVLEILQGKLGSPSTFVTCVEQRSEFGPKMHLCNMFAQGRQEEGGQIPNEKPIGLNPV